jgi:hypothetical protein
VSYLSENWFGRMQTLIRAVVDSHTGAPMDVPTTSNAIEAYHGHMKRGQLARKCVTAARDVAAGACVDACVRCGLCRKHLRGMRVDWLLKSLLDVAVAYEHNQLCMRMGQMPINENVARPGAQPHRAAPLELAAPSAAVDDVPAAAPAPAAAVSRAAKCAVPSGRAFNAACARMTALMADAKAAGAGELCHGRVVAACDELELILEAHAAAPDAAGVSHLTSTAAAAAQPMTRRRYVSCMDSSTHRSSGVAPPPRAQEASEAAAVAPFALAAVKKKEQKRKAAPPTAADLALVAASQARWVAAEAAGDVAPRAKKARQAGKA